MLYHYHDLIALLEHSLLPQLQAACPGERAGGVGVAWGFRDLFCGQETGWTVEVGELVYEMEALEELM